MELEIGNSAYVYENGIKWKQGVDLKHLLAVRGLLKSSKSLIIHTKQDI